MIRNSPEEQSLINQYNKEMGEIFTMIGINPQTVYSRNYTMPQDAINEREETARKIDQLLKKKHK